MYLVVPVKPSVLSPRRLRTPYTLWEDIFIIAETRFSTASEKRAFVNSRLSASNRPFEERAKAQ